MENSQDNISRKEFEAYLTDRMMSAEKSKFQSKLQDDPFASEALEGFSMLETNKKVLDLLEKTNELVLIKTGVKKKSKSIQISTFKIVSIAAVLTIAFGGFYLFNQYLSNRAYIAEADVISEDVLDLSESAAEPIVEEIANEEEDLKHAEISVAAKREAIQKENSPKSIDRVHATPTQAEVSKPEEVTKVFAVVSEKEALVKKEEIQEKHVVSKVESDNVVSGNKPTSTANAPTSSSSAVASSSKTTQQQTPPKPIVKTHEVLDDPEPETITPFDEGLEHFKNNNYTEALKYFSESVRSNVRVTEAYLYSGLCYSRLNQNSNAIKSFDVVIRDSKSPFVDKAKWHKAETLMKMGGKAEAKIILQELIDKNSQFKTAAKELIKTL
jgi:tetratricopeptide (TPR) repeat protein